MLVASVMDDVIQTALTMGHSDIARGPGYVERSSGSFSLLFEQGPRVDTHTEILLRNVAIGLPEGYADEADAIAAIGRLTESTTTPSSEPAFAALRSAALVYRDKDSGRYFGIPLSESVSCSTNTIRMPFHIYEGDRFTFLSDPTAVAVVEGDNVVRKSAGQPG